MNLEGYFSGNSFIHRLDPRGRIVVCLGFAILMAISKSPYSLSLGAFIAIIYAILAKINIKNLCVRLFIVNLFIVFLWFFLPFSTQGQVIWNCRGLTATREGVILCVTITARANIIILFLISLISTIPPVNMGLALQQMNCPKKLVYLFFFAVRYLQVIDNERERLFNAAKVRGFKPGVNLHTYRTLSYFVGMLLVKSIDRSERVHEAMICRGFSGSFYVLEHFSFCMKDAAFAVTGIAGIVFAALLELNFLYTSAF